jgi:hypothetical protein
MQSIIRRKTLEIKAISRKRVGLQQYSNKEELQIIATIMQTTTYCEEK